LLILGLKIRTGQSLLLGALDAQVNANHNSIYLKDNYSMCLLRKQPIVFLPFILSSFYHLSKFEKNNITNHAAMEYISWTLQTSKTRTRTTAKGCSDNYKCCTWFIISP